MRKNLLKVMTLLFIICAMPFSKVNSQTSVPADSIKALLVGEWQRAKVYTQEYMNAMPADKYSFKANDSIRSFAQQLLHLAQANYFFMTIATGGTMSMPARDLEKETSAQSKDSVMYYVNKSYDFSISTIKGISSSSMLQMRNFNMGQTVSSSTLGWLLKAFEHQTHHRGQTTIYLRTAGIHPPQEKLF